MKTARFYKHRPFRWLSDPHAISIDDDYYHSNTGIDKLGRRWRSITLRGKTIMMHREVNQTDVLKIRMMRSKKHIYDKEGTIL